MLDLLIGSGGLGLVCVLWLLWQRLAERIDPGTGSDRRAGGRCSVPGECTSGDCSECNDHA